MKPRNPDSNVFSIVFDKGKAARNRLPLSHIIAILNQVDQMIREVGKVVQRNNGVENPDGDFGIELLAGVSGLAFKKGSVATAAALTKDIENGKQALNIVIGTTVSVEKKKVVSIDESREPVFRRLNNIVPIQEKDGTELQLRHLQKGKVIEFGKFSQQGMDCLKKLGEPDFGIEALTVFGKLKRLDDYSRDDEGKHFWGQLVEDSGRKWRVRFRYGDLAEVQKLFTRQVEVHGDAAYFKTKWPRIDAKSILEDKPRDYLAGFERFQSNYADVFKDRDVEEILDDIRG